MWRSRVLVARWLVVLAAVICVWAVPGWAAPVQKEIPRVELMPDAPATYVMRDWRQVARDYDSLVFDFTAVGEYLPLIQWDKSRRNFDLDTFFLPSYVGDYRQGPGSQEAINVLAALLGATLVGIDKSNQQGYNWVLMASQFFNPGDSQRVVLNNIGGRSGSSFWYEIYPAILFFALVDKYPKVAGIELPLSWGEGGLSMRDMMYETADRYCLAVAKLVGRDGRPDFEYTAFDFARGEPVWNGRWTEPDAAAGIAWLEYMAYVTFGEDRFLQAAEQALEYLESLDINPFYEVLLPYGAYLAARLNAELGREYNLEKLLNWCFGPSYARPGWGVITGKWGRYAVDGLVGSLTDGGGYAFAMNTFQMAAALVPIARYDPRYARALGKWILNLATNARLFYPRYLPRQNQSSDDWSEAVRNVVAYEGLRKEWAGITPYAAGDARRSGWAATDFALYGSSHVGMLGAIVATTNVEKILQLDLLATDFFHAPAYPTYLYYNPYPEAKAVLIDVGEGAYDLYDAVGKEFVARAVTGKASFVLPGRSAAVIVVAPAGGQISTDGNKLLVNGVLVDYQRDNLLPAADK
ncbi:MAG: hypothetical protein IMX00_10695 [Limnochordales bacterium]|nr:hypothetical protein [Limnochordales bacterium]